MTRDPLDAVHAPFHVAPELGARLPVDGLVQMPVACDLVAPLGDRGDCARVPLRGHSKNKERRCRVEAVEEI